jgi:ATP-dependent Clp protease ATP-binding subunit ClpB
VLLQILEDGRLTDSHGRTVNFKNTIVIMTSNIGSPHLLEGIDDRGHIREDVRRRILDELRREFRPEFLNRVDETVLFKPLTLEEMTRIVDLQLRDLRRRLETRNLQLEAPADVEALVARQAFDPVYGARPLKRFIQQHIETPIARDLIAGRVVEGDTVRVAVEGETIRVDRTTRTPSG